MGVARETMNSLMKLLLLSLCSGAMAAGYKALSTTEYASESACSGSIQKEDVGASNTTHCQGSTWILYCEGKVVWYEPCDGSADALAQVAGVCIGDALMAECQNSVDNYAVMYTTASTSYFVSSGECFKNTADGSSWKMTCSSTDRAELSQYSSSSSCSGTVPVTSTTTGAITDGTTTWSCVDKSSSDSVSIVGVVLGGIALFFSIWIGIVVFSRLPAGRVDPLKKD